MAEKRKGRKAFNDAGWAFVVGGVSEFALQRPGVTRTEIGKFFGLADGAVDQALIEAKLGGYKDRLLLGPTFNTHRLRNAQKMTLIPAGPWRVAHCDTTIIGCDVVSTREGKAAKLRRVALITDGLTGWTCGGVLDSDDDLGSAIQTQFRAGNVWEVYVLDNRPDAIRARLIVEAYRREVRTAVAGTIWDNCKVERANAALKRHLAKRPIQEYRSLAVLSQEVNNWITAHNTTTGVKGITVKQRLQNIRRQWTVTELLGLAVERGRQFSLLTPFSDVKHATVEPWAYTGTDSNAGTDDDLLAQFAATHEPGFYWAAQTGQVVAMAERSSGQEVPDDQQP